MKYNSLEDVRKNYVQFEEKHNKLMRREKIEDTYLDRCYNNLFIYNEYYNDILSSYPKYHLKKFLEDKGFQVEDIYCESEDTLYTLEKINEIVKNDKNTDLEKILESFYNKNLELNFKQKNKKEKIQRRMELLNIKCFSITNTNREDMYIV